MNRVRCSPLEEAAPSSVEISDCKYALNPPVLCFSDSSLCELRYLHQTRPRLLHCRMHLVGKESSVTDEPLLSAYKGLTGQQSLGRPIACEGMRL